MATTKGETFLTFAWSLGLYGWGIAVIGLGFAAAPDFAPWLAAIGASYLLLAVGLALSLSAPLPKDTFGDSVPARLRLGWTVMALCPRPSKLLRAASATAAALASLYPFHSPPAGTINGALALVVAASFMEKPKPDLSTSAMDLIFLLGAAAAGIRAFGLADSAVSAEAWQGCAIFASLTLLVAQRTREICAAKWTQLAPGVRPPPALDLSRYDVSAENVVPAERAALPHGVEEQLVDSGSFRVDVAKMLDKLRSFQLSDPADFVCAWLRCAAASGAKEIHLKTTMTGIELAFDGRPFSASELSQPYQVLVDGEGPDARRGRHFAYGLLGLYRLRPLGITVTSRGPDGTAVMRAGSATPPDAESAPDGTVVAVVWPVWASWWRPWTVARRARARFGMGPAALSVDGEPLERVFSAHGRKSHAEPGLCWTARKALVMAQLRLYVLGTLIETLEGEDAYELDGSVGLDDAELNISQTSVVQTPELRKLLERIRKKLA